MRTWSITDVGLVRKENQDAFRVDTQDGTLICVVCDGMGGAAGGKVASETASRTYMEELKKILVPKMTPEQLREASSFAVSLANRAVAEAAAQDPALEQMGTTLVSAVSYDGGAVITNVGDSRAYHISESGIVRVSKDHSLVESMVDHGDITSDEARHHPNRNLITRVLGLGTDA
ncbi:MAG: serine/threonine-protein phosphatase, partial [Oscillibacter sp.]|nr:serine/threonine-protein phosphatase [Oscillibacter sp.]